MNRSLSDSHRHMLVVESAIPEGFVEASGYYTCESKQELLRLGFSQFRSVPADQAVPALILPVHSVGETEPVSYQCRPNKGIEKDGRVRKYESIPGKPTRIHIPKFLDRLIGDPKQPLLVTEGIKKADSAASRNLCCVALPGVWNFRGKNERGGKVELEDWNRIALNGRTVYIVFDSDVVGKDGVKLALFELSKLLTRKGANVIPLVIPSPDGRKVGLDDWFAMGRTSGELLAPANHHLELLSRPTRSDRYQIKDGSMCVVEVKRVGSEEITVFRPLANFAARISEEVDQDDGEERRKVFRLEAIVRDRTTVFDVGAHEFASLGWVPHQLGASAILEPGQSVRDHARAAIQVLSGEIPRRTVYAHTGWRRVDDQWVYLTAGGAIGANGIIEGVDVELEKGLDRFSVGEPAAPAAECVAASLALLNLGDPVVMFPLMASVYLAPLVSMFENDEPDFVTWLWGASGTFKSEIAALAQSHWGSFGRTQLPGSFTSTANSLERIWHGAKDALLVVDDFYPTSNRRDSEAIQAVADKLLRGVGNRKGRERMGRDLRNRRSFPPRGMVLATGERLMAQHSTAARMFTVEVVRGRIEREKLSAAQAARDLLAGAMFHYLKWLARDYPAAQAAATSDFLSLRLGLQSSDSHQRQASQAAHLLAGLASWLRFCVDCGFLSQTAADELGSRAYEALASSMAEHRSLLSSHKPEVMFIEFLRSALISGRGHLVTRSLKSPEDAREWGWSESYSHNGTVERRPINDDGMFGYLDGPWVYLSPEQAYGAAVVEARRLGQEFPVDRHTLMKLLGDAGLIVVGTDEGVNRRTVKLRIGADSSTLVRVLKLRVEHFREQDNAALPMG